MRRLVGVLAVAVVLAGCGTSGDGASAPKDVPAKETAPQTTTKPDDTTTTGEETTTTEAKGGSKSTPLAIGTEAAIGEYNVKVVKVNADAAAEIATLDEYAEPPKNGKFVLISYEATYTGDTEGTPFSDLALTLSGGNAKQYDSYDCNAYLGDGYDGGTIEAGGVASVKACFDAPTEAINGGAVFISTNGSFDGDDDRTFWALG